MCLIGLPVFRAILEGVSSLLSFLELEVQAKRAMYVQGFSASESRWLKAK